MSIRLSLAILVGVVFLLASSLTSFVAKTTASQPEELTTQLTATSPIMFIENVGQYDNGARFKVHGGDHTIWLAEDAIWITLLESRDHTAIEERLVPGPQGAPFGDRAKLEEESRKGVNIRLSFVGANPKPKLRAYNPLTTTVSYLSSNSWHPSVPVWGSLRYSELYPGIDLEMTGSDGRWSLSAVTAADANLDQVGLRIEGADEVTTGGGFIWLSTSIGVIRVPQLVTDVTFSHQEAVTRKVGPSSYEVYSPFLTVPPSDREISSASYGLEFSTYLGGSGIEGYAYAGPVAVDTEGYTYLAGYSESTDFPTIPGSFDDSQNGGGDALVAKLDPTGGFLLYATYVGGSDTDYANGIEIALDGAVYLVGRTESPDFPTTPGAYDTQFNGDADAFITKLAPGGSSLIFSSFLGSYDTDEAVGIDLDASESIYLAGYTYSNNFPTTPGAFREDCSSPSYGYTPFVTKMSPTANSLVFSTCLGGDNYTTSLAIDSYTDGTTFVLGRTNGSFPVTPGAYDTSFNGVHDFFVMRLNAEGSDPIYSTYLGGSEGESEFSWGKLVVDGSGSAFFAGETRSSDFPSTTGAVDQTFNGEMDVVLGKLNPAGSDLIYSTFLGGAQYDFIGDLAIDESGQAFLVGSTRSLDYPTTPDALDTSRSGYQDIIFTKIDSTGSNLIYSTLMGGKDADFGRGIAVDDKGNVSLAGSTESSDFPTTPEAFDRSYNGNGDIFVTKLNLGAVFTITGRVLDYTNNPLPGVTLKSNVGHSSVTNANGEYIVSGLLTATYHITPSLAGYVFSPGYYQGISVPPSAMNKDFTGGQIPAPFLDWPFEQTTDRSAISIFIESTTAVFDHRRPLDYGDSLVVPYIGYPALDNPNEWRSCGLTNKGNLDCYDGHEGYDFRANGGTDIYPVSDGTVLDAGWGVRSNCYGYAVEIDHGNGFSTLYGHLSPGSIDDIHPGLPVTSNTKIGEVGCSTGCGTCSGNHLHLGLFFDHTHLDPSGWLDSLSDPWIGQPDTLWVFPVPQLDDWLVDGSVGSSHTSGSTTVTVPSGAFPGTAIFSMIDVPVSESSAELRAIGHSFELSASSTGSSQSEYPELEATSDISFTLPLTITVDFSDADIFGLDETSLKMYWWDETGDTWIPQVTVLDTINNSAETTVEVLGLFALLAADPDALGPDIGDPVFSSTVLSNQWLTVTVPISDAQTGNNGVANATLFYSYTAPFTDTVISGQWPGENGDGVWSFAIAPQGQEREGLTFRFSIRAIDGDMTPVPSQDDNSGDFYSVLVVAPLQADFSATPTSGYTPQLVRFTNLSTGDIDTCSWDFGDSSTSSDCDDPTHIYTEAGVYTVSLTVYGSGGYEATKTKVGYIIVEENEYKIHLPLVSASWE